MFWILHCFFTTRLLWIYFNRFYGSYHWAERLHSTLAGCFLGGVHWQWPWTLLRIDSRVLGEVLHSVMLPFLFLCNILKLRSAEVHSESSRVSEGELFCERSYWLLVVDCFCKKSSSQMFEFWMCLWGILNYFKLLSRF